MIERWGAFLGAPLVVMKQGRGSFDALASLMRGDCTIAGFHVADGPLGPLMSRRHAEGLAGRDVRLLPIASLPAFSAAVNAIPGYLAPGGGKLLTVAEALGVQEALAPLR